MNGLEDELEDQSLKLYEGLFLFDANLASRDWPGLERHVEDMLRKHSAELVYSERWPDRKLCFEIKGCKKGTYYLTYFNAPPDRIAAMNRDFYLSERVLRLLILHNEYLPVVLERRKIRGQAGAVGPSDSELQGTELRVSEVDLGEVPVEDILRSVEEEEDAT
jgi:ribosomal protein S6